VWVGRMRQDVAERCYELFSSVSSVVTPYCPDWARAVYHLCVVRVQFREQLRKRLTLANIDTGIHYPVPLHLQKVYEGFGYKRGDFPITEKVVSEILSLPMFPELVMQQQARIVNEIVSFWRRELIPQQGGTTQIQPEVQKQTV